MGLTGKKVFIKMDIEGAEYDAFKEISNYYDNITGIVLEIHFDPKNVIKVLDLLVNLNTHFVLLHVHGNNCCINSGIITSNSIGKIPNVIELTYINKNLVKNYYISKNQSHPTEIDMPNIKNFPEANFEILLD